MPLIEVRLIEGRSPQTLRRLITAVTDAVETALEAPRESIRVIVQEVPATHWSAGDETIAERRAGR